ncbi:MAG TPA: hypothetical protein VJV79_02895 [Polyangiaceae bacterium]|nr:hypothetical protein [Polyangiaceae bacterium]
MSARKRKTPKRPAARPTVRPALIQVVPGDLENGVRDLTAVFDDLIDAEMCGSGFERDALVFGVLRRLYHVRGMLGAYTKKAVAS